MAEEQEAKGVLIEGKDIEKFSREHFEKSLENIIKDIQKNGIRKKITEKEKDELIDNVYEPCYNQMKNVFEQREIDLTIPANPWKDKVSHRWKLKTESDIRELFENYSNNQEKYHEMWIDYANTFQGKKKQLGDIIKPAFEKYNLINENGGIPLSGTSYMEPGGFLENFRDVIFNDDENNHEDFYEILHNFAEKKIPGLLSLLERWKENTPGLYFEILKYIPDMVHELGLRFTYQQIEQHRKILKKSIEELTFALEEKLG